MNLLQFQNESKRTMPYNGEPANQVEFENMLGNYAMGLAGEWFEFQTEINGNENPSDKLLKEVGDVLHYSVGLLEMLGYKANELAASHEVTFEGAEKALITILEAPKKHIYHRHELPKLEMISAVNDVIAHFNHNFTLATILQMNIDKLKTRYPEKFSTADSIARVDAK